MKWKSFSQDEEGQIAAASKAAGFHLDKPGQQLVELRCPHCGNQSLRTYLHVLRVEDSSALLTQVWCAQCTRFAGSTGPMPDGLQFDDPVPAHGASLEVEELLSLLDRLWAKGLLPQTYE
jgi:hypothetical protein